MLSIRTSIFSLTVLTLFTCIISLFSCATGPVKVSNISSSTNVHAYNYKPTTDIAKAYNATVTMIQRLPGNRLYAKGTGTIIRNKKHLPILVITAWHVVKSILKETNDPTGLNPILLGDIRTRKLTSAFLMAKDTSADLALLIGVHLQTKDGPEVKVATQLPKIGSTTWVIGTGRGRERNTTKCNLSHVFNDKETNTQMYRTCSPIYFGDSGGGMYNEKQELIGVMHGVYTWPIKNKKKYVIPGSGHAIALPHIQDFLRKALP